MCENCEKTSGRSHRRQAVSPATSVAALEAPAVANFQYVVFVAVVFLKASVYYISLYVCMYVCVYIYIYILKDIDIDDVCVCIKLHSILLKHLCGGGNNRSRNKSHKTKRKTPSPESVIIIHYMEQPDVPGLSLS